MLPTSELSGLHQLFTQGECAVMGNVGPLQAPLTRQSWEGEDGLAPKRLFSHNDQTSTWLSSEPEGSVLGWEVVL